jgi:hypothetical protein
MPVPLSRGSRPFGILICFFLSGAAGLIYQVAWGKELGLIFGHTVYAIATVLAVFMAGLAAGSAYLGSWREQHGNPVVLYAWVDSLLRRPEHFLLLDSLAFAFYIWRPLPL